MKHSENLIINPTILTFITTYKCTSACKSCCFQCNPQRKERLTVDDMKRYIDSSINSYNSLKIMVLTGGESFIYGNKLEEIIRHAKSAGLLTRIVSNGYWAKSYNTAYRRIAKLVDAGLHEINFSTGDDHLEFVPIETIKNAALVSLAHNLTVAVNVESADDRQFESKYLINDPELKDHILNGKLFVMNGLWIPYNKSTETEKDITQKKYVYSENHTRCRNLFTGVTIDPNHRLLACCGITSKQLKYLDLGDLRQYSIKELYDRQFNDFMKIWLATEGAHRIMDFISEHASVNQDYKREHACQICEKILSNEQYLQILKNNHRKVYSSILLKYFINIKENSYENPEQTLDAACCSRHHDRDISALV